jgi:hypothetical protein
MSQRRSVRKRVTESLQIIDQMTGAPLARLGNLSADGLMLISTRPVPEKHVYQVQFPLPGSSPAAPRLEVGIQCLWSEAASGEHNHWAGCHIISISPAHRDLLDDWVARSADGG